MRKVQGQLNDADSARRPLAERMRPDSLESFVGQEHELGAESVLRKEIAEDYVSSILLWGPPGSGKTSLVNIISNLTKAEVFRINPVSSSVKEIKTILKIAQTRKKEGKKTILFIDEIHRLNKAQQDVLLEDIEQGNVIFIGSTTENPSFEVNQAVLSRLRVIQLRPLGVSEICQILKRALEKDSLLTSLNAGPDPDCLEFIAEISGGDARSALNCLETILMFYRNSRQKTLVTAETARKLLKKRAIQYDKNGENHFNLISALHKSMRNSDPDAALYWLARMLEGGEDPLYIARRLIRFASEDIGLANSTALQTAVAAFQASQFIGMPECSVNLAQAVVYFSLLPKSNSIYLAYTKARKDAIKTASLQVPYNLRNASNRFMREWGYGDGYKYAHDYEEGIANMACFPEQLAGRVYYEPKAIGNEKFASEYLQRIKAAKNSK